MLKKVHKDIVLPTPIHLSLTTAMKNFTVLE